MIRISQDIEIEVPPEVVFDFIADPENHLQFTPSLMDIADVQEGDVGKQGAFRFQMVGRTVEGRFVDVAFARPTRRTYELEGDVEGIVSWVIRGTDEGSRVRYRSEIDLPGPELLDTITDPIAERFARREAESMLENLQLLFEEQDRVVEPPA